MSILSQQKQSVNTDFPNIRPSLDLRFALAKKLDPRITFTRGSSGTYFGPDGLMRTAGVNEPRFDHDPVTGQSLGLFIEESRTNLFTRSDIEGTVGSQPTNMNLFGPGNGQTAVVSTDVSLGPNGQSAKHTRGTFSDSNVGYFGYGSHTLNLPYTASVYVYIPSSQAQNFFGKFIKFQVEAVGASGVVDANVNIVDRWQRVSVTYTPTSATSVSIVARTNANAGSFFYTDCWQLELGASPTSYMPASGGSQFTRSNDFAQMLGTNFSSWYNSSEGTFMVDCAQPSLSVMCTISDGTVNNRLQLETGTNTRGIRVVYNGAQTTSSLAYTFNTRQKFISSYTTNTVNYANSGTLRTNIKIPGFPTVNILRIGANVNNALQVNSPIARLTYYPIQLTNQQLINLCS